MIFSPDCQQLTQTAIHSVQLGPDNCDSQIILEINVLTVIMCLGHTVQHKDLQFELCYTYILDMKGFMRRGINCQHAVLANEAIKYYFKIFDLFQKSFENRTVFEVEYGRAEWAGCWM